MDGMRVRSVPSLPVVVDVDPGLAEEKAKRCMYLS